MKWRWWEKPDADALADEKDLAAETGDDEPESWSEDGEP